MSLAVHHVCALNASTPSCLRSVLSLLSNHTSLNSLRQDLLPFLTQQQFKLRPLGDQQETAHNGGMSENDNENGSEAKFVTQEALPGRNWPSNIDIVMNSRYILHHSSALVLVELYSYPLREYSLKHVHVCMHDACHVKGSTLDRL